jgi:hypothetical protein
MTIATALRSSAKLELERDGEKTKFELDVPNWVVFEFAVETEDGETELELEIKWAPVAAPVLSIE